MDIQAFPVPQDALNSAEIKIASERYLQELTANSTMLVRQQKSTGRTETQSFKIQRCKPTIDQIDRLLGPLYGLDENEIDFVVNYDLKFRLGANGEETDE